MHEVPPEQSAMPNHRWAFAAVGFLLFSLLGMASAADSPVPQSAKRFTIDVWNPDDGLPGSSVISMVQTRDGYLWLGTLYGLVRFDGIRFTVFDESNTPELNSSPIVALFEDSHDGLWIGTETAGVILLKDGQMKNLGIGRGSRDTRLASVCEDSTGAVWLYTVDGQLWRYRDGVTNSFNTGTDWVSDHRSIVADPYGNLWVGTDWRLFGVDARAVVRPPDLPPKEDVRFTGKPDLILPSRDGGYWRLAGGQIQKWRTNRLERSLGFYPTGWANVRITSACEDQSGNLMVGTLGKGITLIDAEGEPTWLSTTNGLSSDHILSMQMDQEGTLWVGTDGGGLSRVKRQLFNVLPESRKWTVQSVSENASGGIWIGCNDGDVRLLENGLLRSFRTTPASMVAPSLRAVHAGDNENVLLGTVGLGLWQIRGTNFLPLADPKSPPAVRRIVQAIYRDRGGQLWFGTQNGLVGRDASDWRTFARTNGLTSDDVRAIVDDLEGNLWIGTRGGGLNRMRDGIFTYFHKHDGLPSEDINSLLVDEEGVLWIGTSSGLARLHGGKWTRYTTRDGLISNTVGYLVEDGLGYLWIGSNGGLMRVGKKALNDFAQGRTTFVASRTYRTPDGLPTSECTFGSQPGAIRARDGKLWFPTIKGLVYVDPAQLHPNTNLSPVVIESVLVEGQPQNTNALRAEFRAFLTVPAGRERIEIQYTSLNLSAPDAARFKYRLEGHETEWIEAGNTRVARYSKLPPGSYRFQVTACNEDGIWNPTGSSLAIVVEPPFWRTWWFFVVTVAALLGLIVAIVHYFSTQKLQRQLEGMRQQEALEKERARIARDIHDQLGANLTQVALLGELVESDKDSPEDVEAHARQISQTARDTTRSLDEIVWTVNPSNDTVDGLITYLCKYAQDYFEVAGLRYRLDAPAEVPNTPIPPEVRHNVFLAAKEAVTNVVRHAQATAARLRVRIEPGAFVLELEDNGRGVSGLENKSTRNGLRNMRKRMEDVGGKFFIGSGTEGGAVVRLTVPIGKG